MENPDHQGRGHGFYIQALLYDIDFTEQQCDETYRRQLEDLAREHGAEYLHGILREVDPASAEAIHANNIKRVIRALEFYHLSGKKISEHNETERQKQSPYNFAYFVLTDERAKLYERIDQTRGCNDRSRTCGGSKKIKIHGLQPGDGFHAGARLQGDPCIFRRRVYLRGSCLYHQA